MSETMASLHAASWNIRKCVGLDWRRDPRRVASVLGDLDVDVVALQEADKRLGNRPASLPGHLLSAETPFRPVELESHPASIGWHGNAVLVTKDVHVVEADTLHLPGLEPRGAVIVDAIVRAQPWRVVALHLGLFRQSRQAQKAAIREALSHRDRRPTVIMGDFNEWSPTKGFDALAAYDVHAPGLTFHASRPVAALDRFVVSKDVQYLDGETIRTSVTRMASDHLPIRGTFAVAA